MTIDFLTPELQAFWDAFVQAQASDPAPQLQDAYHFCDNEREANELGDLVLRGIKQATTSLLHFYEVESARLPQVGDVNIVTSWAGTPLCIVEVTSVNVTSFAEVDATFAAIEGEGDKSLQYWREAHIDAFSRECEQAGLRFSLNMPVVCECFRNIFPACVEGEKICA